MYIESLDADGSKYIFTIKPPRCAGIDAEESNIHNAYTAIHLAHYKSFSRANYSQEKRVNQEAILVGESVAEVRSTSFHRAASRLVIIHPIRLPQYHLMGLGGSGTTI